MSEKKKSGLRLAILVTTLLALISLTTLVISNSLSNAPKHLETAKFLHSKFQEGKFLEGFTPGVPEYGFSLEALAQLSIADDIRTDEAQQFLLAGDTSYLYSLDTNEPIPGLVGKYLYASRVTNFTGENLPAVLEQAKQLVRESGEIGISYASTFDYAWLSMGLFAQGEKELANNLAKSLATFARVDGGFGFDQTEATTASSVDATAMAILALKLTESVDPTSSYINTSAIAKALSFLDANIQSENHFVAFDADDVNGTALALMAKKSATGDLDSKIHDWLVAKIQTDGGIGSPWVENAGDAFATAQGYLAIEGKTYLELLGR